MHACNTAGTLLLCVLLLARFTVVLFKEAGADLVRLYTQGVQRLPFLQKIVPGVCTLSSFSNATITLRLCPIFCDRGGHNHGGQGGQHPSALRLEGRVHGDGQDAGGTRSGRRETKRLATDSV